ncbi:MAG: hypothetical protein ACI9MC_000272 [Kiritimatiellia bacterium]|jgi:hypothetical protein
MSSLRNVITAWAMLFALLTPPTAAQTLVNGDMTGPDAFDIVPAGWAHAPFSSNTFLPLTNYVFQLFWEPSANGGTFVNSLGIDNLSFQSEGVSQIVTGLIPGANYTISFEQSASYFSGFTADTHGYWEVSFGGQLQDSALVPIPTPGNTTPWQPQSMQFTATSTSELLRFAAATVNGTPSNFLTAAMGVDGVTICQTGTCGAPGQWLYTVTDANILTAIHVNNGCTTTALGVTQDTPTGPIRRIRGLAYVNVANALLGITREGDLVRVDTFTGATSHLLQLPFGNSATEFWSGLAFDGVDTLYTANGFGGQELVAIKVFALTATLIGSTLTSAGVPHQIVGLDFYPSSAPLTVAPHPAAGVLYGTSRNTQALVALDANTAVVTPVGGNLGIADPQAVAYHPVTGVLYSLDDHHLGGTDAGLATYDFNALQGTQLCPLPFGVIEPGATPDFGWGGLAFVRGGGWSGQGCALAGVTGDPLLVGGGSLFAGSTNLLTLSNAAPLALAARFIAFSSTPLPFAGGMLKPFPFLTPFFFTTPPAGGTVPLSFVMPSGVPPGTSIWVQYGISDGAAIFGVSLSNAVLGLTP